MFGGQIEVAVFVKDACIDQLELRRRQSAPAIFINQSCVWIFRLQIFVERLHVGMRRRGIEIVIKLLHVFAVVSFRAGKTEEALFENWIFAVPKGERETKPALPIRDPEQTVLAPAICAAPRMLV